MTTTDNHSMALKRKALIICIASITTSIIATVLITKTNFNTTANILQIINAILTIVYSGSVLADSKIFKKIIENKPLTKPLKIATACVGLTMLSCLAVTILFVYIEMK